MDDIPIGGSGQASYSIDAALDNNAVAEEGFSGPLESRLVHKNWKARKGAYEELRDLFTSGNPEAADKHGGCIAAAVKDSNASALESGLEMAVKYFSVVQPSSLGDSINRILNNVADKGLSGRPKASSQSLEIFSLCIEDGTGSPVLSSLESVLSKIKAVKHKQSLASALLSLVENFGASVFDFKQIVSLVSKLVQEADDKVRKSARAVAIAFYQLAGEGVISAIKSKDVKASTISEIQKECEAAEPLPEPTRKVKKSGNAVGESTQKSVGAAQASMSAALYDEAEAKPVLKFLPKNFHAVVSDPKAKWSEKSSMIQDLMPHITDQKLQPDDYSELAKTMKRSLSDPNVAMAGLSCKVLLNLCKGLRQHFSREARILYPSLLDMLKEKKTTVSVPLQDTLFTMFEHNIVNMSDVHDDLSKAASDKVILVRLGIVSLIERCATSAATNPEKCSKLMKVTSSLLVRILNEDHDSGVKDAASRACSQFVNILSADNCTFLQNINPKTRDRIASGSAIAAGPATSRRPATARGVASKSLSSSAIIKKSSTMKAAPSQPASQPEEPAVSKADAEIKLREVLEQLNCTNSDNLINGFSSKAMKERLTSASQLREQLSLLKNDSSATTQLADTLAVFFSTVTPGWKDASFQVILEMTRTLLGILGEGPGITIAQRTAKQTINSGIVEKLADMKLKQGIKDLLTRFCECSSPRSVVSGLLTTLSGIKSPKATQEALEWLAEILIEFPSGSTDEKAVANYAIKCLELPTPSVKSASLKVFHSLARISGDAVMRLLKTSDLRAALLKQVEDECTRARNAPAVTAKRTAAAPSRGGSDLSGPRDIKGLIDQSLLEKLSATNWSDRGVALEDISKMLGGKIKPDVGPYLMPALKQRLTDTNKNIIPAACKVVGELFEGLGPPARTHANKVLPSLMQLLGDQKPCVRQGARKALTSFDKSCGLDGLLPYLPKAMSTDVPAARQELSEFLADIFKRDADKLPLNSLQQTVQPLVGFLQDKNPNTRKLAEEMLKPVIENVGYETVAKHIGDLGVAKQRALQPILEKNKMYARSSGPVKPPTKKIKHGHSIRSEPSETGIPEPTAVALDEDIRPPAGMPAHTPIYEAASEEYSEYRPKTMFKSITKDAGLPAQTPLMPVKHSSFTEPTAKIHITSISQAIDLLAHANCNIVMEACEAVEKYAQQGGVIPSKINDIMLKAMNRLSTFCTDSSTPLDIQVSRRLIAFMTDIYQPPLSLSCTTETLFYLIGALLDNLLTEKLHSHAAYKPQGGNGSPIVSSVLKNDTDDILRQLNSLMLKILERSSRTPTFCALIKRLDMYYKLIYNESSRYIKYVELVAKCLLKLIRFVTTENTTVDFTKLLYVFFFFFYLHLTSIVNEKNVGRCVVNLL